MNTNYLEESPQIIKEFLGYMQTIKGKSEKTVNEYYIDLRTFFRYIKLSKGLANNSEQFNEIDISDIDIELIKDITLTDVFEYMNYLMNDRKNGASTRSRKSSSLRTFFKYLTNKTGKLAVNPLVELENPKIKSSLPKYLSLEQCIELLNSVDGDFKERDYCILTLFLNCGMRLSELVGINLNDIKPDNTLKITGKGNKERIVYLNDACIVAIDKYKNVRPNDGVIDKKALFLSKRKQRISPKTVQFIVNKYLKKIGLDNQGYSVHKLRHTAATLMYQYGKVDIRILKDILGHENLGTTQIYTHISDEQMKQASLSNPISKIIKSTSKTDDIHKS